MPNIKLQSGYCFPLLTQKKRKCCFSIPLPDFQNGLNFFFKIEKKKIYFFHILPKTLPSTQILSKCRCKISSKVVTSTSLL